jgi:hypothetical protein
LRNGFTNSWARYRKRRNIALFAFIGYVPIVFCVALLSIRLFHTFTPAFVAAFAWMLFFAIRYCGKRFHTVSLSEMWQVVSCEMVVSQHLCTEMCPLRLAQVRRPNYQQ